MKKLTARDVKDLNLLKHYRIIRKWACKNNGLNDADLELLIYFDCMDLFTKHDFEIGTYSYSWDNRRWNRLLKEVSQSLINGFVLAALLMSAGMFFLGFELKVGITVAVSLVSVIIIASIIGTFVPILLDKRGIDPALATGPFITTSNDILGILIYFSSVRSRSLDQSFNLNLFFPLLCFSVCV